MPSKTKRKAPNNAIVLGDLVFKLGVYEVPGTIQGQQGMACFMSNDGKHAIPLPFNVPLDAYGETFTAFLRTYDDSLVLELGADDVRITELNEEAGEIDITSPLAISDLFEEQKMRMVPQVLSGIGSTIAMTILAVVLYFMEFSIFPFVVVPVCIAIFGLAWSIPNYLTLNRSVVYDAVGNWIDMKSGRTSLDDGEFRYKVEE